MYFCLLNTERQRQICQWQRLLKQVLNESIFAYLDTFSTMLLFVLRFLCYPTSILIWGIICNKNNW